MWKWNYFNDEIRLGLIIKLIIQKLFKIYFYED